MALLISYKGPIISEQPARAAVFIIKWQRYLAEQHQSDTVSGEEMDHADPQLEACPEPLYGFIEVVVRQPRGSE